jgi:hypothetical protein
MGKWVETISFILVLVLFVSPVNVWASKYQDTIPPEILQQYHPDVVSGERPKFVTITQPMIWGLRDQPNQGGDVYVFDFDLEKLSTVQKEIIENWVSNGQKVLIWGYKAAWEYSPIFSKIIEISNGDQSKTVLAKHPVNTDVKDVRFYYFNQYSSNRHYYLTRYPVDTEIMVSIKSGVIAGRVPLGRGSIYFVLTGNRWDKGIDKDRWELNFKQWMLGLAVPGAAEVLISPSREKTESRDEIVMKNGDVLSGKLLTQEFTIQTSYGTLSLGVKEIRSIMFEGGGQNIDVIILNNGDKLSGIVGPDSIKLQLEGSQQMELEKDKIV